MWKRYTENLYRRDKRMTKTFEEDSCGGEPTTLESEVKAALKVLGRNRSLGRCDSDGIISGHRG